MTKSSIKKTTSAHRQWEQFDAFKLIKIGGQISNF